MVLGGLGGCCCGPGGGEGLDWPCAGHRGETHVTWPWTEPGGRAGRRCPLVRAGDSEGQRFHRSHGPGDPMHRGQPSPTGQTAHREQDSSPSRGGWVSFLRILPGTGTLPAAGGADPCMASSTGCCPVMLAHSQPWARGAALRDVLQLSRAWHLPLASHGEAPSWRTQPGGRELLFRTPCPGEAGEGRAECGRKAPHPFLRV